jgi:hypothetical protein
MSFSNIDNLNLGNLLHIVFNNEVYNLISQDFRDFEKVKRAKVASSLAREWRFLVQDSFGPAAVQSRNPGTSDRAFPTAQKASVSEKTAKFKEVDVTIELEYNLWDRARKSPEKYAEPLALEIMSKTSASKRYLAAKLYGDGTGVVGTTSSASDTTGANGSVLVTLSSSNTARGHIGFFEFGDLLLNKNTDGTADDPTVTGTFYAWRVDEKDRENNQVRLRPVNSSGTALSLTSSSIDAGDVFYRVGQPTFPDLTAIVAATDYGTLTEEMAGLESLASSDGRTIHGLVMSGAFAASRLDAGANPIDVKYLQKALDKVKVNVGQDRYKWTQAICAPETNASLIESRETDRRFQTMEDAKRGTKLFGYQHGNDFVELITSEYCPMKRIYMLPESKAGQKVLEYRGTDFDTVKMNGTGDFHLKATSSGYVASVQSFLHATGVFIATHPAAIAVVHNFTNT